MNKRMQHDKIGRETFHVYTETFFNWEDASNFVEKHRDDYRKNNPEYHIVEMRVVKIGARYSAGISFTKGQLELDV